MPVPERRHQDWLKGGATDNFAHGAFSNRLHRSLVNNGRHAREITMASAQELAVQKKKELASKEESTIPARYYVPYTDIYETDDALTVVMEIPGVDPS
jgi:HSP20 family molecular chaperone IbpA